MEREGYFNIWDYWQVERPEEFQSGLPRQLWLICEIKRRVKTGKVLNIGCGSGLFEELASQRGFEVYSLDPSAKSIEVIKERLQLGSRAQVGSIDHIPFPDDFFNAVVASEVLEHLDQHALEEGLKEVHRVLRPGGLFLGTVPAFENLQENLVVCPYCNSLFHKWGHLQSFTPNSIRLLLEKHFQAMKVSVKYFPYFPALNWKGKLTALLKLCLSKVGIHGSNENIVFICRKSD